MLMKSLSQYSINLTTLFLIGIGLIFIGSKFQSGGSPEVPIGTVIYNLIPPDEFLNDDQNRGWVLLDGQPMDPSWELTTRIQSEYDYSLFEHLKDSLPDARGYFLRAMNYNGEGIDTWKDRKVGSQEKDFIKKHTHKYSGNIKGKTQSKGRHSHNVEISVSKFNTSKYYTARRPGSITGDWDNSSHGIYFDPNSEVETSSYWDNSSATGSHSHSIDLDYSGTTKTHSGWKSETRPKNVGLYAYIKVN